MGFLGTRRALIRCFTRVLAVAMLLTPCVANAGSISFLSQNMNRLFDDIDNGNNEKVLTRGRFQQRVIKAAEKFGAEYELPDIIALQEVENQHVLQQIADNIRDHHDADYRPLIIPGQDVSSINLAYLIRDRFEIRQLQQLFRDLNSRHGNPLFSRPPLLLEACTVKFCITLLNVHLRSMRGIDSERDGKRVSAKRQQQAETIASWINRFQRTRPQASLLLLGDFNALTPADKHVDVAGILRGSPDNRNTRLAGRDLLQPDLIDVSALIAPKKRYSYLYRGRKQQLDYMFINQVFAGELEHIAYSPVDSRFSDHAGLLARFRF